MSAKFAFYIKASEKSSCQTFMTVNSTQPRYSLLNATK